MHFVRIIEAYQIWVQILIKSKAADIHVMYRMQYKVQYKSKTSLLKTF